MGESCKRRIVGTAVDLPEGLSVVEGRGVEGLAAVEVRDDLLDAPVMRCASLDTPIPFNLDLERNFLAKARLAETMERLISY